MRHLLNVESVHDGVPVFARMAYRLLFEMIMFALLPLFDAANDNLLGWLNPEAMLPTIHACPKS